MDTSVNEESSMISQYSSSSDQEMEVQKPTVFCTIYKSATIFCATNVCALYQRAQNGLVCYDSLYHRFLKWKLKCENILDCELTMLPEAKKCKKVITGSGDFGMDQYVSWYLPAEELSLDIIWSKYEVFCKKQTNVNEVRARFDLLTSFRQGNRSADEWYNAVQAQVSLAKYPPETASILHRDIFWFF